MKMANVDARLDADGGLNDVRTDVSISLHSALAVFPNVLNPHRQGVDLNGNRWCFKIVAEQGSRHPSDT